MPMNTPSTFQRATMCAAIAVTAAFSAPSFAAVPENSVPSLTIKYGDLDLSKDKDAATLYRRLQTASRGVCSSLRGRELASMQRYRECYASALAEAVNTVNAGTLTALHKRPTDRSA